MGVLAHTLIIIMPPGLSGLNARGLQSKLLITHLVSEAITLLYCRYGAA